MLAVSAKCRQDPQWHYTPYMYWWCSQHAKKEYMNPIIYIYIYIYIYTPHTHPDPPEPSFEICYWTCYHGTPLCPIHISNWIVLRRAPGFANYYSCGIWWRGLTTYNVIASSHFGNLNLSDSWSVSLTWWKLSYKVFLFSLHTIVYIYIHIYLNYFSCQIYPLKKIC